ncbi:hypothetical protein E2C01_091511 [Portunus trituberculatus]|uniref:Uncharacterized protein n=1 Tax=Portunus trituberculatus TaxID=210409 RepID=A0A5B7JJ85_PORTR|nr:hypothetical protein [Portunus trituberculatus]
MPLVCTYLYSSSFSFTPYPLLVAITVYLLLLRHPCHSLRTLSLIALWSRILILFHGVLVSPLYDPRLRNLALLLEGVTVSPQSPLFLLIH